MDQITVSNFAHPDVVTRVIVGDCLKASVGVLPSPTSDGDCFLRFGIPQGGGCNVPHRPQLCLYSDFHLPKFSTISQNCLE